MSVYKSIEPENVLISSFKVHKTFTFTEADSGSGLYAIPIVRGNRVSLYGYDTDHSDQAPKSKTITGSVFQKVPSWHSINNLYYRDIRTMRGYIDYITGVPTNKNAIVYNYTTTVERVTPDKVDNVELRRPYTRQLHESASVISVPQQYYGECIQPSSVRITDNSTDSTYILQDDGRGNIYDVEYSSSYAERIPVATSGSIIGNVFYNDGVDDLS